MQDQQGTVLIIVIVIIAFLPMATIYKPRVAGPAGVIALCAGAGYLALTGIGMGVTTAAILLVGATLLAGLLAIERRMPD